MYAMYVCMQGRVDVVVDGMNVGHYQSPYFNALQIQATLDYFKVLVC
jgi:hypothetical protein